MKPNSRTIPNAPPRISSRPPIRDHVDRLSGTRPRPPPGRDSRSRRCSDRWSLSSEPSSLIEFRWGPFAGRARKIAPLLPASRNSWALCARPCPLEPGVEGSARRPASHIPLRRAPAAIFSPAARRRASVRPGVTAPSDAPSLEVAPRHFDRRREDVLHALAESHRRAGRRPPGSRCQGPEAGLVCP